MRLPNIPIANPIQAVVLKKSRRLIGVFISFSFASLMISFPQLQTLLIPLVNRRIQHKLFRARELQFIAISRGKLVPEEGIEPTPWSPRTGF
jgi:hypothetical protein